MSTAEILTICGLALGILVNVVGLAVVIATMRAELKTVSEAVPELYERTNSLEHRVTRVETACESIHGPFHSAQRTKHA